MLCISSFIRSLAVSSSFFSSFLYLKLSFVLLFDCKVKKKNDTSLDFSQKSIIF